MAAQLATGDMESLGGTCRLHLHPCGTVAWHGTRVIETGPWICLTGVLGSYYAASVSGGASQNRNSSHGWRVCVCTC